MLKEEKPPKPTIPTFWRSVSWTERSPSNPNPRSQPPAKPRSCLPPLSISRRSVEKWPQAGSDDIGEWANCPATPGAKKPNPVEIDPDSPPLREFQLNKDKECSRIADHIYLGSEAVAKNREILRQNGITHVLNCVGFVCPEYFKSDLVYKTLWLQDSPSEDITSILYDVFDYFEEVREMGGRVLVHCCQGISRSTSLVIAYLMWRDGQSFEDAFQFVKSARGVTNPNIGFACQLLQCQKRVHAVPVSPTSVLRMYRMAPHSAYDPLHVVPKMLSNPGPSVLDSRGAFIVHVPSAIYVWIGKHCSAVMAHNARASASQVVRYERVQCPIVPVEEGSETVEFWDALVIGPNFDSDKGREGMGDWRVEKGQVLEAVMKLGVGGKKVDAFDIDFDIFEKALSGGVVPPFPFSEAGGETQVPARESGWYMLRKKFASGLMKEIMDTTRLTDDIALPGNVEGESMDTYKGIAQPSIPSDDPLLSRMSSGNLSYSSSDCSLSRPTSISNSPSPSPSLSVGSALHEVLDTCYETESLSSLSAYRSISPSISDGCVGAIEPSVSSTHPLSSASLCSTSSFDSFSCFSNMSPKSGSKSCSPSPSGNSSLFTHSQSTSNWSDSSCLSSEASPSTVGFRESFTFEHTIVPNKVASPCKGSSPSFEHTIALKKMASSCKESSPSLAERRGSVPPTLMLCPSVKDPTRVFPRIGRSWSFSHYSSLRNMMADGEISQFESEDFSVLNEKARSSYSNTLLARNEIIARMAVENRLGKIHLEPNGSVHGGVNVEHAALFRWPTFEEVDMSHVRTLDSRSVFLLLAPNENLVESESKILYIWAGHEANVEMERNQWTERHRTSEDGNTYWEQIGINFLRQMRLPMITPVQMVQEGKEPMQFLEHFKCLAAPQSKVSSGVKKV
ncbi:hypothetical protein Syun_020398 [Stephania yunnanensis]|uniref:Protein-tyrosine-phosphatase n=1 Tax=Stephania yunnanensis TaxID=152371 RepID=A0AAP0IDU4_9MAGN